MPIGGLDIGSSGAKLTVLDVSGALLHSGYRTYPVSRQLAAHEADAAKIWQTACALLREAAREVPGMEAVGITSFGESFVLLDLEDKPLLPVMMYTDPRGADQALALERKLGADRIAAVSGAMPHPMFSLPKLMWVREHCPDAFARTRRICLMADFVAYMLTGEHAIDYSLAARTMGFDVANHAWSPELLSGAGVDVNLLGTPVPSGTLVGVVRGSLADELGLPGNLHVVLGGHDQVAAAVGSGVLAAGGAANGAGTVECITPVFQGVPDGLLLQHSHYPVIPFPGQNLYCCYAFSFTGGSLVKWLMGQVAAGPVAAARARGDSPYAVLEGGALDRPTGILVLPHFAGAGTPYMDTDAKGAVLGLTLAHTSADLYRAVLEGIVYEDALNLERLTQCGVNISTLHACGGGARSDVWLQMKADILGIPVRKLAIEEAGTVGSIMFSGVATGEYSSLAEAARMLVTHAAVFEPRPVQHDAYQEQYMRYRKAYDAVRPLFDGTTP